MRYFQSPCAAVFAAFLAALLPALLWVGDVSFVNDEPRLIANAYHANAAGHLAERGLRGNFGISYGPVATHIYQGLLLVTHEPVRLASLRAFLSAAVTALALVWLSRSLALTPWFAAAVLLAPYLWLYYRVLWDASFGIPIGALALAGYAAFLKNARPGALMVSAAATTALPFIHPQALPLFVPLFLHMAWTLWPRRGATCSLRWTALAAAGAVLFLNGRYLVQLPGAIWWQLGAVQSGYPGTGSRLASMFGPLLGGELLGGLGYTALYPNPGALGVLSKAAALISCVIQPLIWAGIAIAGMQTARAAKDWRRWRMDWPDPRLTISFLALVSLVLQMLLFGAMRIPAEPQYFFGTAIVHIYFAWLAIDALGVWEKPLLAFYGGAGAMVTLLSLWQLHAFGYNRAPEPSRPSLQIQVRLVQELNAFTDTALRTEVTSFLAYPQALRTLRLLLPADPAAARPAPAQLGIRYVSGPEGGDCRVELSQAPADRIDTAGWLDVSPLPAGWEPGR